MSAFSVLCIFHFILIVARDRSPPHECHRNGTNLDFRTYRTLTIPAIKLKQFQDGSLNERLLSAMAFDDSMRRYSVSVLELDSVESQQTIDEALEGVRTFFEERSFGHRHGFVGSGAFFPFGREQYALKSRVMRSTMLEVAATDPRHIESAQITEPLDAFYVLRDDADQRLPIEFAAESVVAFGLFRALFADTLSLAATALGLDKAAHSAFVNGSHSLKLAHYLRLHSVDSERTERALSLPRAVDGARASTACSASCEIVL